MPTATNLQELSVEISGDGLHEVDGSLSRVVGGPDLPQVDKDGLHSQVDGLKIVGSMKLVDGKLFHQRVVVIHLLLGFLQTYVMNNGTMKSINSCISKNLWSHPM